MNPPQKTIVWIASYPKSGNTWLRFLACNLLFGPQDSASALRTLAPDIHELGPDIEPPTSGVLFKTHYRCTASMPLAAHTLGGIYVVRHPADVLLSNFHYARRSGRIQTDPAEALDAYVASFVAAGGDPRWIQLDMGRWDDNVRSWLASEHPFPVLRLRYEDLLADPTAGARRMAEFLGLRHSAEDLARAVAGASFERMREIELADIEAERIGIFYKPFLRPSIDSGLRFMRSGKAGEGRQALSAAQRHAVWRAFGPLMADLGYEE